ncbi:MAG: hypothetical protein RMH75_03345 [Archaeoglobaceae archaeon]|nr:hypothetical protein [Archaeoglobaceae archaeon]MDW7989691.1 hypothetical protein [Archaeoglobaceae archaeon]
MCIRIQLWIQFIVGGKVLVENGHFEGEEIVVEEFSKGVEKFFT